MYKTVGPVLCFFLVVVFRGGTTETAIKKIAVDIGKNLTIKCPIHRTRDVMWVKEGRQDQEHLRKLTIMENGSLFISRVDRNDSGVYSCSRENVVTSDVKARFNVTVRTPPPPLVVSIKPSTIIVLIIWEVRGNGGYPIINFTAQYRLAYTNNSWIPISPNHITPNCRQIEIYSLKPNTSYEFRIWATNQLGKGEVVSVINTTRASYKQEELARQLLEGAETFDPRVWAVAVGIVMGTLILLGLGTCILFYQECRVAHAAEEQEIIELVPNIILNPGFDANNRVHDRTPDENSNNETPLLLNNNTVVQPRNNL